MEDSKEISRLVDEFLTRRYMLLMGKNKLAKYLKTTPENIVIAKKVANVKTKSGVTKDKKANLPKILIFDLESSPMISYHFGMWGVNISLDQIIEYPILISWSAKWLFGSGVMSDVLTVDEVMDRDDSRITKSIWNLINEADIVVAHYGDKFDLPLLNTRFITNGLPPASNVTSIDTKSIASRNFKFESNKLDSLATIFGFANKIDTDFMLWRKCMEGDQVSLDKMVEYNKRDVTLLEEIYLKLRPYAKGHPNVGLYVESDNPVCAHCGSENLKYESKYYTQINKYDVYRCECGALNRVRTSSVPKNIRKNLMISTGK